MEHFKALFFADTGLASGETQKLELPHR